MANQEEEIDEEIAAERDLGEGAMWKLIQKNTFTRWANEHLKQHKVAINDLERDLSDGLKLINLLESLSGKKFQKYNKKPTFRTQKFENVTVALKFLETNEGIKLVNIDSSDIVDNKLKLIMGLIWTLILHYSITMPMWDDDEGGGKDQTPKQRLLAWIQNKIPEKNITNFTSDWNDGTAIAALVDALGPGLCPDWPSLNPANKVNNAKQAMDQAEKWMDIPQVIKPDEMCNPKVDELSMMTYLSRFPSAKMKPNAPVQAKTNPTRCRAYGPGLELTGNIVSFPARFIVETASAGKGDLEVFVVNPKGGQEKCDLFFNDNRSASYNCVYVPSMEGQYKVTVKFASKEIVKAPYLVNVAPLNKAGDAKKVIAQGPGIERSGVMVNRKTYFEVITKGAGMGVVDVGVVDPQSRPVKSTVTKKSDDVWYVEYTAQVPGLHSVNIYFAGASIPKSPYPVGVAAENGPLVDAAKLPGKPFICAPKDAAIASLATPLKAQPGSTAPSEDPKQPVTAPKLQDYKPQTKQALPGLAKPTPQLQEQEPPASPDAKRCWATGRGVQPKGIRLNDNVSFLVHTENAGNSEPKVQILGPGGTTVQNQLKKLPDGVTYECVYKPIKQGMHVINVTFANAHIQKSPFRVEVGPTKVSKVVAFGPGLEGGVINQPAKFTVQPNGEGPIGLKVEGPSQAKIDVVKDPKTNEMQVTYLPTTVGEYAVRVLVNNDDIPKSPFMADIKGEGEIVAQKTQPTNAATAVPPPANLPVDPSKVKAFGPGLEKEGNQVNKPAEFTVDATMAGTATLNVKVVDLDQKIVECTSTDNKNGTYSCKYVPKKNIKHTVTITYAGRPVPGSSFQVMVKDAIAAVGTGNASKVKVFGPAIEKPVKQNNLTYFIVDCKESGPGEVVVTLTAADGTPIQFTKKKKVPTATLR